MNNQIIRRVLTSLIVVFGLAHFGYRARAQTFAADLVAITTASQPPKPVARIYVSDSKTRIETRALADGFFIVDADQSVAWFLRPRLRVFMDARRSSPFTQIFVRVPPDDACRQWQALETIAGPPNGPPHWECERLASEFVGGREAVKYSVSLHENRRGYRWIDSQRRFPIKVENEDGTVLALQSFDEATPPAALFEVPSGYKKFDPLQLIEQIKQSDVWVEPQPAKRPSGPRR